MAIWRTVWRSLKQLKIDLPYGSAIPLLGTHPKEMKSLYQRVFALMFIAALSTVAKIWNQLRSLSAAGEQRKRGKRAQWNIIQPQKE